MSVPVARLRHELILDGGGGAYAVLVVLLVAQQGGESGGVGEFLHLGLDFVDSEIVVVSDRQFVLGEGAADNAGAVQGGGGGACPFSVRYLFGFIESGIAARSEGVDSGVGDGVDARTGAG